MATWTQRESSSLDNLRDGCEVDASVHRVVTAEAIHLEFKCGTLCVRVTWSVSAATDGAAWLRKVLR